MLNTHTHTQCSKLREWYATWNAIPKVTKYFPSYSKRLTISYCHSKFFFSTCGFWRHTLLVFITLRSNPCVTPQTRRNNTDKILIRRLLGRWYSQLSGGVASAVKTLLETHTTLCDAPHCCATYARILPLWTPEVSATATATADLYQAVRWTPISAASFALKQELEHRHALHYVIAAYQGQPCYYSII